MQISELYKVTKNDISHLAEKTAVAFKDDPLFNYILEKKSELKYIETVIKFFIKYNVLYGRAYTSSIDLEGIILFSRYEDYDFSIFKSLRAGCLSLIKLGAEAGKRFRAYEEFAEEKHEEIISGPHVYIQMLAVNPDYQGKGYGGRLLSSLLEKSTREGYPCYLETHLAENVTFYKRYGFEVAASLPVPGTEITHYCMVKK